MHSFPANPWMRRPRLTPRALSILELLLWAALAVQAVRLVLLFLAPSSPETASAEVGLPEPVAPLARAGDPFGPRAALQATSPAPIEGLVLHGVRVGEPGGAAIIGHAGRQRAYQVGDTIAPGVTLDALDPGLATLRTSSGVHRLGVSRSAPVAAPSALPSGQPATPQAEARPAGDDPPRSMQQTDLQPEEGGGYRVGTGASALLLRRAGLQAGDVVTSADGQPLSPERLRALQARVAAGDAIELTVRRHGRTQSIRFGDTE